ncbi:MAG TPA: hypothetical protein VFX16_01345 [Pseudonocardiaceae bacterium]|nr:hypothetical protein [Pseudonocardiaceae bacterium]
MIMPAGLQIGRTSETKQRFFHVDDDLHIITDRRDIGRNINVMTSRIFTRMALGGVVALAMMTWMAPVGAAVTTPKPSSLSPTTVSCQFFELTKQGTPIGEGVSCMGTTLKYNVTVTCEDELRGDSERFSGPIVSPPDISSKTCPFQGGVQWVATTRGVKFD